MRIISVINQKGGVGKTTTTVNLAHALALQGKKVTCIDLDPQSHLAASFGVTERDISGMDDVLLHGEALEDKIIDVRENIQLVPAGSELGQLEHLVDGGASRGGLLKKALQGQLEDQDFVLIDCPPASGLLVVNALFCTKEVIVPVVGDYLSLHGLSYLIATFRNFERKLGHKIREWIVMTRFHKRRRLPHEIMGRLLEYFPRQVFMTPIREGAALAECPSFGKTIFEYRNNSIGAQDYRELAVDLLSERTM